VYYPSFRNNFWGESSEVFIYHFVSLKESCGVSKKKDETFFATVKLSNQIHNQICPTKPVIQPVILIELAQCIN
jgi:hypothetical protein